MRVSVRVRVRVRVRFRVRKRVRERERVRVRVRLRVVRSGRRLPCALGGAAYPLERGEGRPLQP